MPKILVLGGTGVLGRRVVQRLAKSGLHDVVATGVTGRGFKEVAAAGGTPLQLDVLDGDGVEKMFKKVEPEVVINTVSRYPGRLPGGWKGAKVLDEHNNIMLHGTRGLLKAMNSIKPQRVIAASTTFCTTGQGYHILDGQGSGVDKVSPAENIGIKDDGTGRYSDRAQMLTKVIPRSQQLSNPSELPNVDSSVPLLRGYNLATYRFERLHSSYKHGRSLVLRLGHLYGPGTTFGKGGEMRKDAEKGHLKICKPAIGNWSFVHVDDAASAIALAATSPMAPDGVLNVVDNSPMTTEEWVIKYTAMTGYDQPPMEVGAGWLNWWAPHLHFLSVKQRAARYEGFPETFDWKPEHPPMWECDE